jgi:phosphatidylinositol-3-phosphatase
VTRSAAVLAAAALLAGWGGAEPAVAQHAAAARIPDFSHVLVVVFENREANDVAGSPDAPTFRELGRRYARLTRYTAVAHPSLPNYLALVSGSTHGIASDCVRCVVAGRSLADTLAAAGRTWKAYAEGLPRAGWTGAESGRYAKRHVPFLYLRSVLRSPARRRRVVPFGQLAADVARRRVPDFSLVVPDLCHDMHDCPVSTGDSWLGGFLRPLLASRALRRGIVVVVFDEGASSQGGGGHVPALVLGPLVRPGTQSATRLDHYGLLATIERAWGLPLLGRSRGATPIRGIWR